MQTNQPVPSLLQLAARSICRGNRCLPAGLDNGEGLCQPSMEPDTEGANKSTVSGSRLNSGVEDTAMVPLSTVNISGLATPATQAGQVPIMTQLAVWSISGKDSPGCRPHSQSHMTHCLGEWG